MREYWANVYAPEPGVDSVGAPYPDAAHADENACRNRYARIHVRLKPEGAPKRYRDDVQRWAWEDAARRGTTPRYD